MVADFSATPYFNYLFYQVLGIALSAVVLLFTVIVTMAAFVEPWEIPVSIIWRSAKVRWRYLLQVIEFSSFRVKQQEVCIYLYYFIMKE